MTKIEILDNKTIRCFYEEVVTDAEGVSTKELKVALVLPTDETRGLPSDVQAACAAIHTDKVISAYQATVSSSESE